MTSNGLTPGSKADIQFGLDLSALGLTDEDCMDTHIGSRIPGSNIGLIKDGVTNEELYGLLNNVIKIIENNRVDTDIRLKAIESRLGTINESMKTLLAAISINPVLSGNVYKESNKGTYTTKVMSKI